jgi:CheY-like chemotaxis protein
VADTGHPIHVGAYLISINYSEVSMADDREELVAGEAPTTKTLLLVEDDASNGMFFEQVISQETPYLTRLVITGAEALAVVKEIKPNLFILDYRLHDMNGVELYDLLHDMKGLEDIPAIIMSASLDQHAYEIEQRHLIGIGKPIELDDFIAVIERVINGAARSKVARSTVSRALVAACSLSLILFSCIGAVEGIANAQANTPHLVSATTSATKPTRTPPGRHSPTPTAPAPSPTLAATLTTIPTLSANATSPVKVATPSASQKQRGSQKPTPISTQPTPSTTSTIRHTSYYQQKGNPPLSPVVIGILSSFGGVMLLLIIGLLLLRKYLMPSAKVRLSPSGATPWQRVRIKSVDDHMSSSGSSMQTPTLGGSSPTSSDFMPTTDGYSPTTRNVIPSRRGFSSTTSNFALEKKHLKLPTAHFLRPTRLKTMHNSGILTEPKNSALNPSRQNSQPRAVLRKPWEERDSEEPPSLDDPVLRETLQNYMLRGSLLDNLTQTSIKSMTEPDTLWHHGGER